ncbi:MAG: hypothetical protein AAFR37_07690, partial [Cyanobacteria bacterium J06628_3]
CIAHPFFDMFLFYFRRDYNPLSSIKAIRNEYLNQWTVYEPNHTYHSLIIINYFHHINHVL